MEIEAVELGLGGLKEEGGDWVGVFDEGDGGVIEDLEGEEDEFCWVGHC